MANMPMKMAQKFDDWMWECRAFRNMLGKVKKYQRN